ncbi:MAG: DUF2202 domain-containing protein [Verrucomicrobiales bacterium]|nr:DUF2202 domain-containing protein [Verrucomicrobiales bacterium]
MGASGKNDGRQDETQQHAQSHETNHDHPHPRDPLRRQRLAQTPTDADNLLFLKQEEKVARDVYQTLGELWAHPTFLNIARSEQRHMDAVDRLIAAYALTDSTPAVVGEFTIPALQELHDQLVLAGAQSLEDALAVGVLVEVTDIEDIDEMLAATQDPLVIRVLTNLRKGSENHLAAFNRALENPESADCLGSPVGQGRRGGQGAPAGTCIGQPGTGRQGGQANGQAGRQGTGKGPQAGKGHRKTQAGAPGSAPRKNAPRASAPHLLKAGRQTAVTQPPEPPVFGSDAGGRDGGPGSATPEGPGEPSQSVSTTGRSAGGPACWPSRAFCPCAFWVVPDRPPPWATPPLHPLRARSEPP